MHIIGRLTTFQSVIIHILKVAGDEFKVVFVTLGFAIKAANVAVICVQPNDVLSVSGKPEGGALLRHDLPLRISLTLKPESKSFWLRRKSHITDALPKGNDFVGLELLSPVLC